MRVSLLTATLFVASLLGGQSLWAIESWLKDPASSSATEANAVDRIPFQRITGKAQDNIRGVVERPSFFRRLPTQTIECDPELFTLLVRYPEIIVNIWDLMGITKVEVKRVAPYVFAGQDGAGTTCRCELLYGTSDVHVYYGNGAYSGTLAPRDVDGRCVCVLHSSTATSPAGRSTITVSMDIFLKLDNLGADLLTRTLGPLVGKTADYNFVESAKFVGQLNQLCEENPLAAAQLAQRLNRVDPTVRTKFAQVVARIAASSTNAMDVREVMLSKAPQEDSMAPAVPRVVESVRPPTNRTAVDVPPVPAKTVGTPGEAAKFREHGSSRSSASASLSDSGLVVPVKPPVSLRR